MARNIHSHRLTELGSSGYEIVADEPDIRKWKVSNANGRVLGIVDELLVDKQLKKIRYIVLKLEGRPLNLVSRRVLIPIGIAEIDQLDDIVILPAITITHLATLPTYTKGKLTFETERKIRNVFSVSDTQVDQDDELPDDKFYQHDYFDDRNLYERRRRVARKDGEAVRENAEIKKERREENKLTPFREGTIEITERSEVPVVTKEARVVEEVSVNKDVTERDERIKDSVKRNEVEVERLDEDDKF